MEIDCIWQGPADLGEEPMWHPHEQVLYFIDIEAKLLHRLDPKSGDHKFWQMPDYIGAVVPRAHGGMIAAVGQHVVAVDIPSGRISELAKVIPDGRDDLRMNDGKCDRQGRFWVGVANLDVKNPQGGLFRLDPDGTLTEMERGITISNGLGWSPDNKTFYYTDGLRYRVYAYDFDEVGGTISNRRVFIQLEKSPAEPEGLTVDSEGNIWQAVWESHKIYCHAPDGSLQQEIAMPVARPTSCIIGGADYDTLYVTSCSKSIGEESRLPAPAGAIFALKVKVAGLPEPSFAG